MVIFLDNSGNVFIQLVFPGILYQAIPALNCKYKLNMYLTYFLKIKRYKLQKFPITFLPDTNCGATALYGNGS